MFLIISNVLAAIGSLFLVISQFKTEKKDVIKYGIINCIVQTVASIFAGAFSRIIVNIVAFTRDLITYKDRLTKQITIILMIVQTILGVILNNKGYIGMLPIIASLVYTMSLFRSKTAQGVRIGLLINVLLWIVHDLYIGLYTSLIGLGTVFFSSLFNIIRIKNK